MGGRAKPRPGVAGPNGPNAATGGLERVLVSASGPAPIGSASHRGRICEIAGDLKSQNMNFRREVANLRRQNAETVNQLRARDTQIDQLTGTLRELQIVTQRQTELYKRQLSLKDDSLQALQGELLTRSNHHVKVPDRVIVDKNGQPASSASLYKHRRWQSGHEPFLDGSSMCLTRPGSSYLKQTLRQRDPEKHAVISRATVRSASAVDNKEGSSPLMARSILSPRGSSNANRESFGEQASTSLRRSTSVDERQQRSLPGTIERVPTINGISRGHGVSLLDAKARPGGKTGAASLGGIRVSRRSLGSDECNAPTGAQRGIAPRGGPLGAGGVHGAHEKSQLGTARKKKTCWEATSQKK